MNRFFGQIDKQRTKFWICFEKKSNLLNFWSNFSHQMLFESHPDPQAAILRVKLFGLSLEWKKWIITLLYTASMYNTSERDDTLVALYGIIDRWKFRHKNTNDDDLCHVGVFSVVNFWNSLLSILHLKGFIHVL